MYESCELKQIFFCKFYEIEREWKSLMIGFSLIPGWCLFGQFSECLRSRLSDTICRICWICWCILVLWCWQLFHRRWIDAWTKTRHFLACMLDVHQSSISTGHIYILIAWIWRYAWRRVWISRLEYSTRMDTHVVINSLHTSIYYIQTSYNSRNDKICEFSLFQIRKKCYFIDERHFTHLKMFFLFFSEWPAHSSQKKHNPQQFQGKFWASELQCDITIVLWSIRTKMNLMPNANTWKTWAKFHQQHRRPLKKIWIMINK